MNKLFNLRKNISFLLLAIMIFALIPINTFAESQKKNTNVQVVENTNKDYNKLKEQNNILEDENSRLRDEIRKLSLRLSDKNASEIPILMYHHIIKQADIVKYNWSNNGSVLSLETFEEQMKYLYDNGYYTASLEELELYMDGKIELPEKTVIITFDDGYLSNGLFAYPVLKKYNFRATIFMIGYRVNGPQIGFDPSDTQALAVSEVYKYKDVFDFESHTYNLHHLNNSNVPLLTSSTDDVVKNDLLRNKGLLKSKYLAYPYGKYSEKVIQIAEETGHGLGFTIEKGFVSPSTNKFKIPRNGISQTVTMEQFMNLVDSHTVINNTVEAKEVKEK